MKFQIIFQTSRKVTIEFLDFGIYFTEKKYRLLLNGKEILTSDRVVQTISGLTPDTEYELTAVADGEAEETVRFKTDYEFVTLNVRRFGARGDGKHDDTGRRCHPVRSTEECIFPREFIKYPVSS